MKKIIKFLLGTVFIICILAGLGYLGLAVYYEDGFSFLTYINGVYCTGKSVEEVNRELNEAYVYEGLEVKCKDGAFYIAAEDIGFTYDYKEPLNHYLEIQNPYLWIENLTDGKKEYTLQPAVCFDEILLYEAVDNVFAKQDVDKGEPVRLELTDIGFQIIDTKLNLFDISKSKEVIKQALTAGKSSINLVDEGCYYDKPYTDEELDLLAFYEILQKFQNRKAVYLFDDEKEELTSADLIKTLSFYKTYQEKKSGFEAGDEKHLVEKYTDADNNLLIDEDSLSELLDEKLSLYNTYQNHTFVTHDGRTLQIKGGTYGNKINMKTEKKELLAFLQSSQTEFIRTPEYSKEAPRKGKDDIGGTYIEVDIGQQKMFYYRNGELFIETDVVTGKNNATREEVCYVYAKQKNRTLRGADYESFVYYWMPVSGGIGIHDATWRSEFGGDIYLKNGSHGCINTPVDIAKQMYEVMEIGTPCILYYALEEAK